LGARTYRCRCVKKYRPHSNSVCSNEMGREGGDSSKTEQHIGQPIQLGEIVACCGIGSKWPHQVIRVVFDRTCVKGNGPNFMRSSKQKQTKPKKTSRTQREKKKMRFLCIRKLKNKMGSYS
ncbi:unnamed protein product, partial [Ectocarpus sp. 4 AP-2014]